MLVRRFRLLADGAATVPQRQGMGHWDEFCPDAMFYRPGMLRHWTARQMRGSVGLPAAKLSGHARRDEILRSMKPEHACAMHAGLDDSLMVPLETPSAETMLTDATGKTETIGLLAMHQMAPASIVVFGPSNVRNGGRQIAPEC